MAKSKFQYRGNLAETALPEILSTIERFRVPGFIEATRKGLSKRVFIRDGYVIHCSSNDRNDSLGVHLRRSGKLSLEDFERITEARSTGNKRFGVLLMEHGLLAPVDVYEAIREQIEAIVWSLFHWQDGEVTFSVGEFKDENMVQIQLPLRRVIVEGIKQTPDARRLVGRLGKRETLYEPSYRAEDLIEIGLDASEYALLRQVDSRMTLYELCSLGPKAPAEIAKLLYAFQALHLIRRVGGTDPGTGPVKIRMKTTGDGFSD